MSYEVGQIVRVKENAHKIHDKHIGFVPTMIDFEGKTFAIRQVKPYIGRNVYMLRSISITGHPVEGWNWCEDWLELSEENKEFEEINENELMSLVN